MCVTMNPIQKRITGDGNIKKKKKKNYFKKLRIFITSKLINQDIVNMWCF